MLWTPGEIATWINGHFYPAIKKSRSSKTKIVGYEEPPTLLIPYVTYLKEFHEDALSKMDLIGIHWYRDFFKNEILEITHLLIPNKPIMVTEACVGIYKFKN